MLANFYIFNSIPISLAFAYMLFSATTLAEEEHPPAGTVWVIPEHNPDFSWPEEISDPATVVSLSLVIHPDYATRWEIATSDVDGGSLLTDWSKQGDHFFDGIFIEDRLPADQWFGQFSGTLRSLNGGGGGVEPTPTPFDIKVVGASGSGLVIRPGPATLCPNDTAMYEARSLLAGQSFEDGDPVDCSWTLSNDEGDVILTGSGSEFEVDFSTVIPGSIYSVTAIDDDENTAEVVVSIPWVEAVNIGDFPLELTGDTITVCCGETLEISLLMRNDVAAKTGEPIWTFLPGTTVNQSSPTAASITFEDESCGTEGTIKIQVCDQVFEVTVLAINIDLEIGSLPEETNDEPHELNPGGIVPVNYNDNDGVEGPDNETVGPLDEPDSELVSVSLSMSPLPDFGTVDLEVSGNIALYEDDHKKTVIVPGTWDLADTAQRNDFSIRVLGSRSIEGFGEGEAAIELIYGDCSDRIRIQLVNVNLEYMNVSEERLAAPGDPHETDPGGILIVNDNDNDGWPGVDLETDGISINPDGTSGDIDLQSLNIMVNPPSLPPLGTVTLTVPDGLRIWHSAGKGDLIASGSWDLTIPSEYAAFHDEVLGARWVEGTSAGSVNIRLSYSTPSFLLEDKVSISVKQASAIFSGDGEYGYDKYDQSDPNAKFGDPWDHIDIPNGGTNSFNVNVQGTVFIESTDSQFTMRLAGATTPPSSSIGPFDDGDYTIDFFSSATTRRTHAEFNARAFFSDGPVVARLGTHSYSPLTVSKVGFFSTAIIGDIDSTSVNETLKAVILDVDDYLPILDSDTTGLNDKHFPSFLELSRESELDELEAVFDFLVLNSGDFDVVVISVTEMVTTFSISNEAPGSSTLTLNPASIDSIEIDAQFRLGPLTGAAEDDLSYKVTAISGNTVTFEPPLAVGTTDLVGYRTDSQPAGLALGIADAIILTREDQGVPISSSGITRTFTHEIMHTDFCGNLDDLDSDDNLMHNNTGAVGNKLRYRPVRVEDSLYFDEQWNAVRRE